MINYRLMNMHESSRARYLNTKYLQTQRHHHHHLCHRFSAAANRIVNVFIRLAAKIRGRQVIGLYICTYSNNIVCGIRNFDNHPSILRGQLTFSTISDGNFFIGLLNFNLNIYYRFN